MRASAVHKAWRDRGRVRLSSELHIAAVVSNSASRSSSIGINRRRRSGGGLKIFSPNERDGAFDFQAIRKAQNPKAQIPKAQKYVGWANCNFASVFLFPLFLSSFYYYYYYYSEFALKIFHREIIHSIPSSSGAPPRAVLDLLVPLH